MSDVLDRKKQHFEDFKLVHDFVYPASPLKKWINKDHYSNLFDENWGELMKLVDMIECLAPSALQFFENSPHCGVVLMGHSLYVSTSIEDVYDDAVMFLRQYKESNS